ncbi:MAG: hypothetical protein ACREIA_24250 [Opitutaceae bacterium]
MPYWLESFLNSPQALLVAAIVVVAVVLWIVLTKQPATFKAFDTAGGEVKVTRKAVRDLVRRCCEELKEVTSASVHIRLKAGTLHVRVRLRVLRSANLKAISGYLREQISRVLTDNLGVEGIGDIEIIVASILEDPKPVEG